MNGHMVMGKFKNWQRKYYIVQINYKHSKGGYGRQPMGDVYTCNGFLPRMGKFEKIDSRTFFYKLIKRFVNGGISNLWELPFNRIYGTK